MANSLYDRGRQGFLAGEIDWDANNIKLVCINETGAGTLDPVDLAVDEDLADITAASRIATSANFAGKTTTAGVADANDVTLTSVTGDIFESLTIYQDTGTEATSLLIANIDTATGLPLTPDGGNVTITWDSGGNRIFKL